MSATLHGLRNMRATQHLCGSTAIRQLETLCQERLFVVVEIALRAPLIALKRYQRNPLLNQ
jgi:hypothetical protein